VLRRKRVGQLSEFTNKPVADDMFEAELTCQIEQTLERCLPYRESPRTVNPHLVVTRGTKCALLGRCDGLGGKTGVIDPVREGRT
jgi:hypothetical protein